MLENPTQTTDTSSDFANSISQAIQSLNAGAEGLQAPINEEELMKMFTAGEGSGQENNLLPFMQGKKNYQDVKNTKHFSYLQLLRTWRSILVYCYIKSKTNKFYALPHHNNDRLVKNSYF